VGEGICSKWAEERWTRREEDCFVEVEKDRTDVVSGKEDVTKARVL
jgi:hypothetical protein